MEPETQTLKHPEFREAFLANERLVRINTGKLACALVFVLMPLGTVVDYFVYRDYLVEFLRLRLLCSLLVGVIWLLHSTPLARKHYPVVGLPIVLLPAFFMTWMIYLTKEPASSYYAALNLILLAVSAVGHWSMLETLLAVGSVILFYLVACALRKAEWVAVFANLYFLALTGIIVVCGNYVFNRLRFREFTLTFELDQNRRKLEENNRKLMELDEVKSRFFANISHELRTPLALLLAPMETLMRQFNKEEQTRELLLTMHSNGMRLLKLINDLLELVRLQSGRMEVKRELVDPAEFIKGLVSSARQMADSKGLTLECHVDTSLGPLMSDRGKLEKIILNLVFNALKFTPKGGRVEVGAERQGQQFVIKVTDTGIGIAEKNIPRIFDRFWQVESSSTRKYQGVGIGLALVKELTEIQGGTVTVESQEGHGTVFTVILPYEPGEIVPATIPQFTGDNTQTWTVSSDEWLTSLYRRAELFPVLGASPGQQPSLPVESTGGNGHLPSLLIADDEPDMRNFLKSQLSSSYRVIEAVDGKEAVEKAFHFLPDMIILDMMMPQKDGLQACREIREHTPTRNTPILLLTARADEDTKLASLSAGASDFLSKPFSTTELQVRIKNLVDLHGYQRTLARQNTKLESTIEQLKETETRLVQSEKLNSLTRWSAEIIHQMNNPLNYANMALESLHGKSRYIPQDQQKDYDEVLADARDGIRRLKEIVSELKVFAHPETESRDHVEVSEIVAVALRFLRFELEGVKVEVDVAPDQTIWANKSLLIHVLMNLLQNSADALRKKSFPAGEYPSIRIAGKVEKDKSILVVRDNGSGISQQNRAKIFDPFFTTKDVGEGMGLGLAICYRVVQDSEGRIDFNTEEGKFCEFTLEFPLKG